MQDASQVSSLRDELRSREDALRTLKLLYADETQRSAVLSNKLDKSQAACQSALASENECKNRSEELERCLKESKATNQTLTKEVNSLRHETKELHSVKSRMEGDKERYLFSELFKFGSRQRNMIKQGVIRCQGKKEGRHLCQTGPS